METIIGFDVQGTVACIVVLTVNTGDDGRREYLVKDMAGVPSKIPYPAAGSEGARLIAFESAVTAALELIAPTRVAMLTATTPAPARAKMEGLIAMAAERRGIPVAEVHVNALRPFEKKHGASPRLAPMLQGFVYLRDVKLAAVRAIAGSGDV